MTHEHSSGITRDSNRGHCVVIGAGLGGLVMARSAADHFQRVTVIERDGLPGGEEPRRGVPQGHHAHALLVAGAQALERLFPGIVDRALAAGAVAAGPPPMWGMIHDDTELRSLYATRPLLEGVVRTCVEGLANVDLLAEMRVEELHWNESGTTVVGVHVRQGERVGTIPADLVIDCSGRVARTLDWLAGRGRRGPEVSSVNVDIGYGTACVDRRPGDLHGLPALLTLAPLPLARGAAVLPIEGDRWIVTFAGAHGDHPPSDWQGFIEFARTMPPADVTAILERSAPQQVRTYRFAGSQRRHAERWRPVAGHLLAGDALCSFNPIYGQGMSVAVLEAEVLGDALSTRRDLGAVARSFYRRAARLLDTPWTVAACRDFAMVGTTGDKPRGTDLMNSYLGRYAVAATQDPALATQMMLVQNLLAPPRSLLRPHRAWATWRLTRGLTRPERLPAEVLASH